MGKSIGNMFKAATKLSTGVSLVKGSVASDFKTSLGLGSGAQSTSSASSSPSTSSATSEIGQIGSDSLAAQAALAGQQYDLENTYRTKYADLASKLSSNAMLGTNGAVATIASGSEGLQTAQNAADTSARTAALSDLQTLGPGYYQAWKNANPQLAGVTDKLYTDATSGSDLLRTLKAQSLDELQKNGRLNTDELREAQQSVRSAYGARGLAGSNAAVFAEAMNRQKYVDARKAAAQDRALQVDKYSTDLTNNAATTLKSTTFDPNTILDRTGTGVTSALGTYGLASEQATGATPTLFNPYSSDIMSYYTGKDANATATTVADKNSKSATTGAAIGGGAAIAGAAIIAL